MRAAATMASPRISPQASKPRLLVMMIEPLRAGRPVRVARLMAGDPFRVAAVERKTVRRNPFPPFSPVPLGKDTLGVPGHERYGFLELKKPGDAWDVGTYLVKLFITPLGQQSFHAGNQVGTMRFTIVEGAAPAGVNPH